MVKAPAKHTEREKHGWCFPRKNKIGCYDHSPYKNNYLDFERNVNHFQVITRDWSVRKLNGCLIFLFYIVKKYILPDATGVTTQAGHVAEADLLF
ncbi:hypothetical protein ANANG_G00182120 [Anguilla anguilla]|uniref:Uncharacterized protein n=1 Tax=Anguilla anguilla TaxID=7936 RepID=A0A9D3RTX7_ANGAN|nr:hypothetical protein ANANG_G00182120 [Anguilla anguilla]